MLTRRKPLRSKTPLEKGAPTERKTPIKKANPKRKRRDGARCFGVEAKRVKAMRCLVACKDHGRGFMGPPMGWSRCRGRIDPAHAMPRKMGGVGSDRMKMVPLCRCHHDEAGEYGTTDRKEFEKLYGLDLVAEMDRIALEHPEPLGIRGLAKRWAAWHRFEAGEDVDIARVPALDAEHMGRQDDHEREALLGWVRRRLAALGEQSRRVAGEYYGAFPLGESWREDAAEAIAADLELDDVCSATALCEAAGWPT